MGALVDSMDALLLVGKKSSIAGDRGLWIAESIATAADTVVAFAVVGVVVVVVVVVVGLLFFWLDARSNKSCAFDGALDGKFGVAVG